MKRRTCPPCDGRCAQGEECPALPWQQPRSFNPPRWWRLAGVAILALALMVLVGATQ